MADASGSQPVSSEPVFVVSMMQRHGETGVQTHLNEVLKYLKARGHEAHFIGAVESVRERLVARLLSGVLRRAIHLHSQAVHYLLDCISFYAIRAELRRSLMGRSSWIVYAQDTRCASAALSLKTGKSQRVVLAVHFNDSQADEMANRGVLDHGDWLYRLTQRREREALERVDGVVFFSRFMEQQILRQGVEPRSKVVVPNSAAEPTPDLHAEPRDLIAIGSLEPRKNQSYLLDVIHEAALRGHLYTLTLVGSGEDRTRLEDIARTLGLEDQVFFTGTHPAASSLLAAHKALVHAAKIENLPIALIEALAAGKPILAPRVGGIPEIFSDGVEGFFWPLDDPATGAAMLIRIMEDKMLHATMSSAASMRYQTHFAPDLIFPKLLSFLCEMKPLPSSSRSEYI